MERLKRGDVWTVSGKAYAGKPRPAVVLQDNRFDATESVTICPLTTDPADAPLLRLLIDPTEQNGLQAPSRLMVDKMTTVPKARVGRRIGALADEDMMRLNRAVVVFFGLAGASSR